MDNFNGALMMILAMAGFAGEDSFIKLVAVRLPIGEILVLLGATGTFAFGVLAGRRGQCVLSRAYFHPAMLARSGGEIVGTAAYVHALTTIPFSLAATLLQAVPIFATLGAIVVFREPVGWRRWLAIGLGLTGVLIILRPGLAGFRPEAIWGVVAAAALATRDLATRRVPAHVHPLTIATWGFSAVVVAGVALLAASGGAVRPSPVETAQLAAALGLGMVGYYALTRAMQLGDISFVTPFRYVRLVIALIVAAVVFAERPDALTLAGAAIVVGSGLYTLLRERALMRRAAPGRRAGAGSAR